MKRKIFLKEGEFKKLIRVIIKEYSKDEAKEIQKILIDKGYDLGKYGVNNDGVDGIIGRLTRKAMKTEFEKNPSLKNKFSHLLSDYTTPTKSEKEKSRDEYTTSFGGEPGNTEVILVGGLDHRSGDYKISGQVELLKKNMIGSKNVIGHRHMDIDGAIDSIKNNPKAKVVLFSAGCKHADKISKVIGSKKNLFIVEPYAVSPRTTDSIRRAISSGVPESNVVVGPNRGRGNGVVSSPTNTPSGTGHWGALQWVGSKI